MGARRTMVWAAGFVGLILLAGTAWWVGASTQSPEQAAARAAEPPASWITAEVEFRVLTATVIQRGDVRAATSSVVNVPSSVEGTPVVTQVVVQVGDDVQEGTKVIEVSGRPVFVLQGDVPVYRTLRPGMSGDDVAQLQTALARLGFQPDSDGVFGEATKGAVLGFYRQAGYDPVPASATADADLAGAEQSLADAETAVTLAQAALDAAGEGEPDSAIASAEAAHNEAKRSLDAALANQTNDVALKQQEIDTAVAKRDALAANPEADPAEVTAANLDIDRLWVEMDTLRRSAQNAVDAAREALRVATLALNEARQTGDTKQAQVDFDAAVVGRERAQRTLDVVRSVNGPTVAQGEIMFVPTMPARVLSAVSQLGVLDSAGEGETGNTASSGGVAQLGAGGLVVSTSVRPGDAGLVRVGMHVELLDETTSTTYDATIGELADEPVVASDGQLGYPAVITPIAPLPDGLTGANLRVTIKAASTDSEALVVPLAAVSSSADGTTRVSIVDGPNGVPVDVAVEAGLSADGFVVITPVESGAVEHGDLVVVGS